MKTSQTADEIILRDLEVSDLDSYFYWNLPSREFHNYNGPYYRKMNEIELREHVDSLRVKLENGAVLDQEKIITHALTNEILGAVNWYWKSEETFWMEIGIVIFNEDYWGKGIGYIALKKWVDRIFESNQKLVRLGLTTWSGNNRMIKLAQKLTFRCEAVYRKARIVNGEYYDSISYGVLREEWEHRE